VALDGDKHRVQKPGVLHPRHNMGRESLSTDYPRPSFNGEITIKRHTSFKYMPETKQQKVAACIALGCKEGKIPKGKLKGASLNMYKSMSLSELKDFCHSKPKSSMKA